MNKIIRLKQESIRVPIKIIIENNNGDPPEGRKN
mgnify:CR=1 FL=1